MEKTLTKRMALDRNVKEYIVQAIDSEGYEANGQIVSDEDKLAFLKDTFIKEYGWAVERYGEYRAFKEWLQGLPSCFNVDFENYKIIQIAVKWGSIPADYTEKQADRILENWFSFITVKTFQLFRKYKIS